MKKLTSFVLVIAMFLGLCPTTIGAALTLPQSAVVQALAETSGDQSYEESLEETTDDYSYEQSSEEIVESSEDSLEDVSEDISSEESSEDLEESINYSFDEATGTLAVTGNGAMADYTSASQTPWYSYQSSITKVVIEEGVTSVGDYAFSDCTALTSVSLPQSLTRIGNYAFYFCNNLADIAIPAAVEYIGDFAFYSCAKLTSVVMPEGLTYIGISAFEYCITLATVTIPQSLTAISGYAFNNCNALNQVYYAGGIPQWDAVEIAAGNTPLSTAGIIYNYVPGTTVLAKGSLDTLNWHLDSNGLLVISGTGAMLDFTSSSTNAWRAYESSIKEVYIKNSITSIGSYAFYDCYKLTSITIPDSVTSIGSYAFYYCYGLTSITIPDGVTSIGSYAFYNCSRLTSVTIPDSVTSIGSDAFRGCSKLTSITIPDSVTSISSFAFDGCYNLTSITIPDSVTSIGSYAFRDCFKLTSINIPDSVTAIGRYAFYGCSGLTSITIPDSVTSIGDSAFCDCDSITSINIPDSVTAIGDSAFSLCSGLTSINIPDSVTSIGDSAFNSCSKLTSITITDSVTAIGSNAFYGTGYYNDSTNWENNVLYIGNHLIEAKTDLSGAYTIKSGTITVANEAFSGCSSVTGVTITDSVTAIGESAFDGCTALTKVNITDVAAWCAVQFEYYDDNPLYYAKNLYLNGSLVTKLVIPADVTSITPYAFYNCTSVTSVSIPGTVSSIGSYAFYGCTNLKNVYYGGSSNQWSAIYIGSSNSSLTNATKNYNYFVTLSFVADHGSLSFTSLDVYPTTELSTVTFPTVTAHPNFRFVGWDNLSGTITQDTVITAIFVRVSASVSFIGVNGEVLSQQTVPYGQAATVPTPPHYEGYEFAGWMDETGNMISNFSSVREDISVLACYKDLSYDYSAEEEGGEEDSSVEDTSATAGTVTCPTATLPQSDHNYANSIDETWNLYCHGATSITITFSSSTQTENNYDKIYIYDGNGTTIGTYMGTTLAGKTITVTGDIVKIRLTSDGSQVYYGFSLTSATARVDNIATASWQMIKGNGSFVYFVAEHGTMTGDTQLSVSPGTELSTLTYPTVTPDAGYVFLGWDKTEGAVNENTTVKAIFGRTWSTVEFKDSEGNIISTQTVGRGYAAIAPAIAEREGYTVAGWATQNGVANTAYVTESMTLTAAYEQIMLKVYFVTENGSLSYTETTVPYGTDIQDIPYPTVTPDTGYHLTGWDKTEGAVKEELTLTAQFALKTYTVSFTGVYGEVLSQQTVPYGQAATAPQIPPREGYNIIGWKDQNGNIISDFSSVREDMTLTASYEQIMLKVYFAAENGSLSYTETTVPYGTDIQDIPYPTVTPDTGYHLTGWDKTEGTVKEEMTLTAQFDINTYTVSFTGVYGDILSQQTVTHGQAAIAPAAPVYEGYEFAGWMDEAGNMIDSFDVITGDISVLACYKDLSYDYPNAEETSAEESFEQSYEESVESIESSEESVESSEVVVVPESDNLLLNKNYTVAFDGTTNVDDGVKATDGAFRGDGESAWNGDVKGATSLEWMGTGKTITYTFTFDSATNVNEIVFKAVRVASNRQFGTLIINDSIIVASADATKIAIEGAPLWGDIQEAQFFDISVPVELNGITELKIQLITDGYCCQYDEIEAYSLSRTVNFVAEHGTMTGDTQLSVSPGTELSTLTYPTVTPDAGYVFLGWDKTEGAVNEKITVKAIFERIWSTVEFKDVDGTVISTQTVGRGYAAIAPAIAEREGYTVAGWANENGVTNTAYVTESIILTASYEQIMLKVYFAAENGSLSYTETTVPYGTDIQDIPYPTVTPDTGYNFVAWDKTEGTVKEELTLTAQFAINTYTVSFMGVYGETLSQQTVTHGFAAIAPAAPVYEGYEFAGWMDEAGNMIDSFDVITGDMSVLACYKDLSYDYPAEEETSAEESQDNTESSAPNGDTTRGDNLLLNKNYTVAFDGSTVADDGIKATDGKFRGDGESAWNGDTKGDASVEWMGTGKTVTYTFTFDSATNVNEIVFKSVRVVSNRQFGTLLINDSLYFMSYEVTKTAIEGAPLYGDEQVDQFFDISVSVELNGITELKIQLITDGYCCQYDEIEAYSLSHTVNFVAENGTMTGDTQLSVVPGTELSTLTYPTVTPDAGYVFLGWDKTEGAVNENTTVKAIFGRTWSTVEFKDSEGNIISTQTVGKGYAAIVPQAPVHEGYTVAGWANENGVANTARITNNMSLTPIYEIMMVKVNFVSQMGTLSYTETTVPYGTDIKDIPYPTATPDAGYNLIGWDITEGTVKEEITLTAQFALKVYVVSFKAIDGSIISEQRILHGFDAIAPKAPAFEGYDFIGWAAENGVMTSKFNNITANASYTACYKESVVEEEVKHFEFAEGADATNVAVSTKTEQVYFKAGGMSAEELSAMFAGAEISITKANGAAVTGGSLVGTGCVITSTINGVTESRTIVVLGDINGDGKVNATDYAQVLNHAKGKVQLSGIKLTAANVAAAASATINAADYGQVLGFALGRTTKFNTAVE